MHLMMPLRTVTALHCPVAVNIIISPANERHCKDVGRDNVSLRAG